jgi:CBS domain-containing protein
MATEVLYVSPDDTVQIAAWRMRESNVGFLPVCDEAGRPVGMLTDRDIAVRAVAANRLPSECRVGEIMTRDVVACRATDDLADVERAMVLNKKTRIVVTKADGTLQGVVSLSDVAQCEKPRRTGVTVREITAREARW